MADYRRVYERGGLYFFTVVTADRRPLLTTPSRIESLRASFRHVMTRRPFRLQAIVVLPDHLHCLWQLPADDADFSNRWKMLKSHFTRHLPGLKRPIWQPRFWEHLIRDTIDQQRHLDYIHFNPVKHGLVDDPSEWPFSSFHRFRQEGIYPRGWGREEPRSIISMDYE